MFRDLDWQSPLVCWDGSSKEYEPAPVFFINRRSDLNRRSSIERALGRLGLEGERIEAVEGLLVPSELRSYFFSSGTLHSSLTPGEVGCYASHLITMQTIVNRGLPYALILEDDAMLSPDIEEEIADILARLPAGWDLVHICQDPCRATKVVAKLDCGLSLVRYSRVPATTTGYLVSRAGAEKFLRPSKRYWPIDTDFRRPWAFKLEIYGLSRRIVCADTRFCSSIHLIGNHSRARRGFPVPRPHCWTGNPLHTPLAAAFNMRRLGLSDWLSCLSNNTLRRAGRHPA